MSHAWTEHRSNLALDPELDVSAAATLWPAGGEEIERLSWPVSRLGEAVEALGRRSGLAPVPAELPAVPDAVRDDQAGELGRWVIWSAERLGLEAKPLDLAASDLDAVLRGGGPALIEFTHGGWRRFFLLLASRFGRLRMLGPDLQVHVCSPERISQVVCAALEAPLLPEIDRLLDLAAVPSGQVLKIRSAVARQRLGVQRVGRCWLLRLPPQADFRRHLREVRVWRSLGLMLSLFAGLYALEIVGWSVVGDAALNGRLDLGWLSAWMLLTLSIIPMRLLGGWLQAKLSLDIGRVLKSRLLYGALKLDLISIRRHGVGQLLGRVMDAQAFEGLALNGGLAALVAIVELGLAAWVLSVGAGGGLQVFSLLAWVLVSAALSLRYFRQLRHWTFMRRDMTHGLIERMVGHRTTLVQEIPDRRDRRDDTELKNYVGVSGDLDRSSVPFLAGVASGWTVVGLAALVPAFASGIATPASMAVALGGVLLANRAFSGISSGLEALARAIIAWQQIGPMLRQTDRQAATAPFIGPKQMEAHAADGVVRPLLEADSLTYRYDEHSRPAVDAANIKIRHGDRILIEGPSGGGKSTLGSLLVGLRKPESGLLLLNGLDRHTLEDSWRQFATEAPQFHENHVLSGTLGFNLLMGRNWPATDQDLQEAHDLCIELGLGDLLQRMPSGMMQIVGETGWQLSHGERSRIFLARALLQKAELTILDESFAALDPETLETCLACALRHTKTLVVIAHP
ncbi:MAG: transporter ATP-binding protein [Xanthobacteraceae bacterium]|nr:transporter ATP-binding protein [Xanthobacteraceae bacterium]